MKKFLILLVILSIIPLTDLFHPGLPITHDGQDHVARIANFYLNLTEGNIIPRWAPNLNWGYGHPILMFLYPLPSYAASFFHFLGFSLIDSLKIIFGLAFSLSGIVMFLWLREFLDDYSAFAGGLLYMFAPYRFVDMYVRGDIGEHLAFVFMPLIMFFLLKLSREKKYNQNILIGEALSVFGLLLSHNAVSVMFLPVAILYSIFLIYSSKEKKELIKRFLVSVVLGFGLSSFFLLPAFFEGKYTLRDIVTAKDYATRFVDFGKTLYGPWSYGISGQFSVEVGIIQWLFVLLSIPTALFLFKNRNKVWSLIVILLVVFVASIFLMLPYSKFFWDKISLLQKFQFPWRFLILSVFSTAVLGAIVFNQFGRYKKFILVLLIVLVIFASKDMWHAKGYLFKPESFFTGIYNGTTDTGESAPIWSVRFMEKRPLSHARIILGNASIREIFRNATKHQYLIDSKGRSRVRENTLYFPGWQVFVDGKKTNIQFQDPQNRGLITFFVPNGKHKINVDFGETNFRLFSDIISVISIILLIVLWKSKLFRLS